MTVDNEGMKRKYGEGAEGKVEERTDVDIDGRRKEKQISRGRSKLRSSRDDELQGMTSFEGGVGDEIRGTSERPASRENSENPSRSEEGERGERSRSLESDLKEEAETGEKVKTLGLESTLTYL
ncbi:uncharacterized protein A4U43_C04F20730 [Asparagus officinalis]|uniref:Uncharacterized protein n=1 Tax=Asparagus officinalis TaxID=4686 RepID=A0A5P1F337_ASPOF|nr:uncharacterized protein A4U43_C04F20730 [Asparagus officinalis]